MEIKDPDVIIVGSGAGGGTAAKAFTDYGLSVVVFEKGPRKTAEDFVPYDELHFQDHKALRPLKEKDPDIYVGPKPTDVPTRAERWWNINMVGGSTMIWEANLPRYTEEDFQVLTVMKAPPKDTSMVNWPWTYDEFQPYFERAEHEWGVSGRTNQVPLQEPTRPGYEYPMPPIRAHASTEFVQDVFRHAGMYPYFSPRGINSRTYNGRPGCPFCGYCQNFGCAVNDRASSTNTVLAAALASGRCDLRVETCVTRIDHKDGRVQGVFYKASQDGKEEYLAARKYVIVSIQAIQSARLFLLSEIPDPNKLIGRYLTYHAKGSAEFTFKGRSVWDEGPYRLFQPRTSLGSLQLRDLYKINDRQHPEFTKGGKFSIYDPFTVLQPIRLAWGTKLWGQKLQDRLVELRSQAGVSFSFTGETMSMYDNYVELERDDLDHKGYKAVKDPWGLPVARVHYRHHEYDMKLTDYALKRVAEIMTGAGGEARLLEAQTEANNGYGHNHGTLRAGKDAGSSVLNEWCESHTVKGLFCLDAAWMPTAGASNPTLTQIANVYRVCDHLATSAV